MWTSFPPFRKRRVRSPCSASNYCGLPLSGVRPLRAVASEASSPYRTAVRWASGYSKDGLVALARKSRTDEGERRRASTQLIEAIEGLALAINGLETLSVDVVEIVRENLVVGQA